jgi:N-acetylglutamate synthase-like GNAT family acetyltransferase
MQVKNGAIRPKDFQGIEKFLSRAERDDLVSYRTKQTLQRFADAFLIVNNRNQQPKPGHRLHRYAIIKLNGAG